MQDDSSNHKIYREQVRDSDRERYCESKNEGDAE